jgi:WhiB family redox-sensing transcriptional regulator
MTEAVCRGADPELFHPGRGRTIDNATAKAICAACPVANDCLEYALDAGIEHGIWGGTSERQRRVMRRQRREAAA